MLCAQPHEGTRLQASCPWDTHSGKMLWDAGGIKVHRGLRVHWKNELGLGATFWHRTLSFPGTGHFSWKVHPWHMHICRPLMHRQKSKNLQFLEKNQQWFCLLQNVAISHLGLDPSPCIISVGHEPSSVHVHLQAKTQSHMIFIMLRKVMQFKTF